MSAIKIVTDESFAREVRQSPRPVLVEYWAQWCGPCRQLTPVLEAIAAEHAGQLDVVKMNVDENPQTAQRQAILAVPTMQLFSGGTVVTQVVGVKSKSALLRELGGFLALPASA